MSSQETSEMIRPRVIRIEVLRELPLGLRPVVFIYATPADHEFIRVIGAEGVLLEEF